MPTGTFCWADLLPADQERAIAFYSAVAGWNATVTGAEYGGYAMAYNGHPAPEVMVAGINPAVSDLDPGWTVYLATSDLGATLASVIASGGEQLMARMDIPGMGAMALCREPAGATFGIWEATGHAGFGAYGEPGAFCWAEVHSTDAGATRAFFEDAFGLRSTTLEESPAFTYYQLSAPGEPEPTFGVMQLGGDHAAKTSAFSAYLYLADVDDAIARALAAGATLDRPAVDTGFGRMATLLDSEGAAIRVIDPAQATRPV